MPKKLDTGCIKGDVLTSEPFTGELTTVNGSESDNWLSGNWVSGEIEPADVPVLVVPVVAVPVPVVVVAVLVVVVVPEVVDVPEAETIPEMSEVLRVAVEVELRVRSPALPPTSPATSAEKSAWTIGCPYAWNAASPTVGVTVVATGVAP